MTRVMSGPIGRAPRPRQANATQRAFRVQARQLKREARPAYGRVLRAPGLRARVAGGSGPLEPGRQKDSSGQNRNARHCALYLWEVNRIPAYAGVCLCRRRAYAGVCRIAAYWSAYSSASAWPYRSAYLSACSSASAWPYRSAYLSACSSASAWPYRSAYSSACGVGVSVGVLVGVFVGVFVGVSVGVFVGVSVGVFVGVSVGVVGRCVRRRVGRCTRRRVRRRRRRSRSEGRTLLGPVSAGLAPRGRNRLLSSRVSRPVRARIGGRCQGSAHAPAAQGQAGLTEVVAFSHSTTNWPAARAF